MLALVVEPNTGAFEQVNAGHPPALGFRSGRRAIALPSAQNVPLGMVDTEFETQLGHLATEDALLLYTDGLMHGGREASERDLARVATTVMTEHPNGSASALRQALASAFANLAGTADDDCTFVIAKRVRALGSATTGGHHVA
jgi:serine phosphatase RsbU (regulator of sigma subunit)